MVLFCICANEKSRDCVSLYVVRKCVNCELREGLVKVINRAKHTGTD